MEDVDNIECKCEQNDDQQLSAHQMTLDEAIEHANEVASNESCDQCANEHKQLADWLTELKDIKSRYAYLAADFDNYKKRTAKSEQYAYDRASENVITAFLRTYDDMKRLYDSLNTESTEPTAELSKEHSAYVMIFENLEKTLNSLGCTKIECKCGDKFDVNVMEAISTRDIAENEAYEADDVVDIYQTGWKRNEKVIRPVKVVVGK